MRTDPQRRNRRRPGARWMCLCGLAALATGAGLGPSGSGAHAEDGRPLFVVEAAEAEAGGFPQPYVDAFLGVVAGAGAGTGVPVDRVVPGSCAEDAGLARGDLLVSLSSRPLSERGDLSRALADLQPGDRVLVEWDRGGSRHSVRVRLRGRRRPDGLYREARLRLGIVPVRFAGEEQAPDRTDALRRLLLAPGAGAAPGGSMADYFAAQSRGRFALAGEVLAPVLLDFPREHYAAAAMGTHDRSPFQRAAVLLEEREDAARLSRLDGLAFLYEAPEEDRPGRALWPHRASVVVGGRRVPYYVHAVGRPGGDTVGGHCHEFAHVLGLPDAYGHGHVTGSGDFCLMAIGHRGGGATGSRVPFSLCAWCRMRLGWVEPVVVDPRKPQRIRLRPALAGPRNAVVVPFTRSTGAYLLLETRVREDYDAELPAGGLLVWRVGCAPTPGQRPYGSHVDLLEAHGVDTFDASLVRPGRIAFPTARARDITPDTVPATWSGVPRSFELHLTDLVRERDGSVTFTVGVEKAVRQGAPEPHDTGVRDGLALRRDPVTGRVVEFHLETEAPHHGGDAR